MEYLEAAITLPVWAVVLFAFTCILIGVLVSLIALALASKLTRIPKPRLAEDMKEADARLRGIIREYEVLSGKGIAKDSLPNESVTRPDAPLPRVPRPEPSVRPPVLKPEPIPFADIEVEAGLEAEPEPVVMAPVKQYKPVPPVRQHYWYYVSGVAGRFSTLRDALSALEMRVPDDRALDWKKLTSDTRAKIRRVKIGDKQPDLVATRRTRRKEVRATPETVPEADREPEAKPEVRTGSGGGKKPVPSSDNGYVFAVTKKKK